MGLGVPVQGLLFLSNVFHSSFGRIGLCKPFLGVISANNCEEHSSNGKVTVQVSDDCPLFYRAVTLPVSIILIDQIWRKNAGASKAFLQFILLIKY